MPTVNFTRATPVSAAQVVTWAAIPNGDNGQAIDYPAFADMTVQFTGTFGAGGTVVLEGSNDGTNYVTLTDPQGNAIEKTDASIEIVSERPLYVRPRVTAGDGTTEVNVILLMRRG